MPLVSMRQLLDHAAETATAFRPSTSTTSSRCRPSWKPAEEVGAPVILQACAGARKYAGEPFLKHLILAAIEAYPTSRW